MKRSHGGWIVLTLLALVPLIVIAQEGLDEVQPKEVHAVKVSDSEVIETFRRGQLISPTIAVDSVEFIDVTRNGFGQGDLMIVYPQERVFPLLEINETERAILDQYEFEENKTYSAPTLNVTQIQEDARVLESPFGGILATVVKGVDYYYDGDFIQGIFRINRQSDLATLTLWNYSEPQMGWQPGSPSGIADTLMNYDLLKVYIRELTTDTVYVPVLVDREEIQPGEGIPDEFLPRAPVADAPVPEAEMDDADATDAVDEGVEMAAPADTTAADTPETPAEITGDGENNGNGAETEEGSNGQ